MKESILRDKLREFQLFIMENRYSRGLKSDSKNDEDRKKGEAILKDFFNGMVEGKPITKAIEILEYIKEHKREKTRLKLEIMKKDLVFGNMGKISLYGLIWL